MKTHLKIHSTSCATQTEANLVLLPSTIAGFFPFSLVRHCEVLLYNSLENSLSFESCDDN